MVISSSSNSDGGNSNYNYNMGEKRVYMIMSRHANSEQNQNIRLANESFENVATFKYLRTTLTSELTFMMKSRAD
jgi:hypothetical protein